MFNQYNLEDSCYNDKYHRLHQTWCLWFWRSMKILIHIIRLRRERKLNIIKWFRKMMIWTCKKQIDCKTEKQKKSSSNCFPFLPNRHWKSKEKKVFHSTDTHTIYISYATFSLYFCHQHICYRYCCCCCWLCDTFKVSLCLRIYYPLLTKLSALFSAFFLF